MIKKLNKSLLVIFLCLLSACASTNSGRDEESSVTDAGDKVSVNDGSRNMKERTSQVTALGDANYKNAPNKLAAAIKAQNDDAIMQSATEVLTQNPKDVTALNALAMVHFKRGRNEAAEYLLNKALQITQSKSELYNNLGLVKLAKGENREAVALFRKGLQVNGSDVAIGANLGALYVKEKDYSKAELALEIPYKKGVKDPKVINNYAVALTGSGNISKASDVYSKAIKDYPSQRDIMLNYAILLIDHQQKYREGLDLLNRLKFVGTPSESRNLINDLESKAKAGLN
ncbi:MAG: tetratricopeptide repeat protein [Pseudobdellovibrio sp.]